MEPALCGCGENYLNFGCFYDSGGLSEKRPALTALREANQAVYPAVYAHLRAARDLTACARRSAENRDPEGLYRLTRSFFTDLSPARDAAGPARDVFLRAWTPEGLTDYTASAHALCHTCVALRDPCGLSAPLLERLARQFQASGLECVRILSPVDPGRLEGLLIPAQALGFLALAQPDGRCAVTVDAGHFFHLDDQAKDLLSEAGIHCAQAAALLAKAKALHDEIEAVCRPFVRFDGVDLLTKEYRNKLRAELLSL